MGLREFEDEFILAVGILSFFVLWKIRGVEWVIETALQTAFFVTVVWYIAQKIQKRLKKE